MTLIMLKLLRALAGTTVGAKTLRTITINHFKKTETTFVVVINHVGFNYQYNRTVTRLNNPFTPMLSFPF